MLNSKALGVLLIGLAVLGGFSFSDLSRNQNPMTVSY